MAVMTANLHCILFDIHAILGQTNWLVAAATKLSFSRPMFYLLALNGS